MAGTNAAAIRYIDEYKKKFVKELEENCRVFCNALCMAAINFRESSPGKHDFTGNLLNSIVTCLYKDGSPIYACYAAERVPKAIQVKMTAGYRYTFGKDYEQSRSFYNPEVDTNEGWGEDDAKNFFNSYRPAGHNMFDIVVAYPTEYAGWVELRRGTTGIVGTYDTAARLGVDYLKLPRVS